VHAFELGGDELQEQERRGVGGVQVVEDDEQGPGARCASEER
jgi:hypothetical protein